MASHISEKYTPLYATVLSSAEQLSLSQIEHSTPVTDRPTWGVLEQSLTSQDEMMFTSATAAFEKKLSENTTAEFATRTEAEAAAILAMITLFKARFDRETITATDMQTAAALLRDIRELTLQSSFNEAESYAFELEILITLLESGHLAFPSSPREETSQIAELNSDVYLFSETSRRKVPISAKLGAKKTAHYSHGVRSVSRKDWQRKDVPLIDYLRYRIPEIQP